MRRRRRRRRRRRKKLPSSRLRVEVAGKLPKVRT
jgi:hypothetical protein